MRPYFLASALVDTASLELLGPDDHYVGMCFGVDYGAVHAAYESGDLWEYLSEAWECSSKIIGDGDDLACFCIENLEFNPEIFELENYQPSYWTMEVRVLGPETTDRTPSCRGQSSSPGTDQSKPPARR